MSEQAPVRIYEKDKETFDVLRAMPISALLAEPVTVLPLAVRALRYCEKHNVQTIGQLTLLQRSVLLKARNMGRKTVLHIEAYLNHLGLGLDGRIVADVPANLPPPYQRGAQAMRLAILTQLTALNVPFDVVQAVSKLPLPTPEDA